MSGAAPRHGSGHRAIAPLLAISDAVAAILLAADLLVVCGSVLLRSWFNAPVEWADDVARGLMVGSSFFGAASALAFWPMLTAIVILIAEWGTRPAAQRTAVPPQ